MLGDAGSIEPSDCIVYQNDPQNLARCDCTTVTAGAQLAPAMAFLSDGATDGSGSSAVADADTAFGSISDATSAFGSISSSFETTTTPTAEEHVGMFGEPCLVCGEGMKISLQFASIEYVAGVVLTCGTIQSIGIIGVLDCPDPEQFDLMEVCGCVDIDSKDDSNEEVSTTMSRFDTMTKAEYAELLDLRSIYDIRHYGKQ